MMKPASIVLLCLACALPSEARAQAPGDPPAMAQVRAGDAYMSAGQYREAAQQYEAAYALDPDVSILERLAEAYRLSGDAARAAVIGERINAMRGGEAPPPVAPPPYMAPSPLPTAPVYTYTRPSRARRAGDSLISTGLGLLISGYALSIIGGALTMGVTYATNNDGAYGVSWYPAGGMLFIPIGGPFATIAYNSNYWWAVPWAVIGGGLQLSGLSLAIAGGIIRATAKPTQRVAVRALPFTLSPYTAAGGGGLVLSGRF